MSSSSRARRVGLREVVARARASVRPLAVGRKVRLTVRYGQVKRDCRVDAAALQGILHRFLAELVGLTPRGRWVELSVRTARRNHGPGIWAELGIRSPSARLGNAELDRLLRAVGPMKLAEVITDLHRGELRVTVLSRIARLSDGWFVIRQGARRVPLFAIVCKAEH